MLNYTVSDFQIRYQLDPPSPSNPPPPASTSLTSSPEVEITAIVSKEDKIVQVTLSDADDDDDKW